MFLNCLGVFGLICIGWSFRGKLALRQPTANKPAYRCHSALPNLFASNPPGLDDCAVSKVLERLDKHLAAFTSVNSDINSLIVAVGTSNGPLWYKGYGSSRANESLSGPPPDLDTIYRIASITKMFVTLDTLILRNRGVLDWDDPIDKYIPSFAYRPHGWSANRYDNSTPVTRPPITFRQLASHLSGMGRDYPPENIQNPTFPRSEWNKTRELPTEENILEAIRTYPLIAPQYKYPIYSNTGFNVLGMANLAAAQQAYPNKSGYATFQELMKTDIFDPIGLDSSFYEIPPGFENRMAVSLPYPQEADIPVMGSVAYNPAGGQASSARDLLKLMTHFLAPSEKTILSPTTIDEWFRPIHVWNDGLTQTGAPWEILRLPARSGGTFDLYTKGGNLGSYHLSFAVDRATGYGLVVLMTGLYSDAAGIAAMAAEKYIHPAFSLALVKANKEKYSGTYQSLNNEVVISMRNDQMWADKIIVNGTDYLQAIFVDYPVKSVALWPTGEIGEFRLAIGRPEINDEPRAGCEPYWVTIDPTFANYAPFDLIYFKENGYLVIPPLNITAERVKKQL